MDQWNGYRYFGYFNPMKLNALQLVDLAAGGRGEGGKWNMNNGRHLIKLSLIHNDLQRRGESKVE